MKTDSIIFDLDGTLWDAVREICDAWNSALARHPGVRADITVQELQGLMGLHLDEIARRLFPGLPEAAQQALMRECSDVELAYLAEHGARLYPNLEKTLKALKSHYRLFIVSNCQDGYIQCFFKAHGLGGYFSDFECAGVTGLSKGENIRLIIRRNLLQKPIYVGDTLGDEDAARHAGIPFVYARYGFGQAKAYDAAIDSIEELLMRKWMA
jgi:phosphoglycolate phosphatase